MSRGVGKVLFIKIFTERQVRRLWNKKKVNKMEKQLEVQGRFKEGVEFAAFNQGANSLH